MVLDSIDGQDKKTTPPMTPFANTQLQDAELLSVEGNHLGDRLPGLCLIQAPQKLNDAAWAPFKTQAHSLLERDWDQLAWRF